MRKIKTTNSQQMDHKCVLNLEWIVDIYCTTLKVQEQRSLLSHPAVMGDQWLEVCALFSPQSFHHLPSLSLNPIIPT